MPPPPHAPAPAAPRLATADMPLLPCYETFFQMPNLYYLSQSHLEVCNEDKMTTRMRKETRDQKSPAFQSCSPSLFHPSPIFCPHSLPVQVDPSFIPIFQTRSCVKNVQDDHHFWHGTFREMNQWFSSELQ